MSSKNLRSPVTSTATLSLQPKSEPHELIDQLNTSSISSSTSHTSNFKKTGKKMNVAHANETKNKSKGESEDELLLEEVTKSSENTLNKTKRSPSNSSPSPNSTPKSSSTSSSSLSLSPNSKSSPSHTHSNSNFHSHSHSHSHFSRLCRNVTIYGFCKNETKGCKFFHPTSKLNHSPPFSAFPITSENASSSSTTHATTLPSTVVSSTNEFLPSATHLPFSGSNLLRFIPIIPPIRRLLPRRRCFPRIQHWG
ncbi:hypothetical protein HMI54_012425 [Coelomomyces lativittatus]|nr:hypothetical protein HMI54_012425 [Coelomomyces lativittatus]